MRMLIVAAAAVLCTACVSAPENVREQASGELACDASRVNVKQRVRHYLGEYSLEAEGCGQKLIYECEQAYVLFVRVGTLSCHKR